MKIIEKIFNDHFSHWDFFIPLEDIKNRSRGKICKAGWAIWYLFGKDGKGEFLDYYATHRMTNDRHVRIYESGEIKGLPTLKMWHSCSDNPAEDKKLEEVYYAENKRISKMLEEKGFGINGDEPGAIAINRFLITNKYE